MSDEPTATEQSVAEARVAISNMIHHVRDCPGCQEKFDAFEAAVRADALGQTTEAGEREREIAERLAAATPGPWEAVEATHNDSGGYYIAAPDTPGPTLAHVRWMLPDTEANARLMAAAPEDVAYLLAEVRRARAVVAGRPRHSTQE